MTIQWNIDMAKMTKCRGPYPGVGPLDAGAPAVPLLAPLFGPAVGVAVVRRGAGGQRPRLLARPVHAAVPAVVPPTGPRARCLSSA